MKKRLTLVVAIALLALHPIDAFAQFVRARVGTDFPLQYFFAVNYQHGKKFSADLSAGLISSPYNNELYDVIAVPERFQSRKKFLQNVTDDGSVLGLGVNYNFGKWYAGLYGQRIILNASASYNYIIHSDLVQEELLEEEKDVLNDIISSGLPALFGVDLNDRVNFKFELYQVGLKFGRRFFFKNPRWELRVDLSYSRNVSTTSTTDFNVELLGTIATRYPDIADNIDFNSRVDEIGEFFTDYGHIPTLNFGLSYLVFIPKKIKEKQEQRNQE